MRYAVVFLLLIPIGTFAQTTKVATKSTSIYLPSESSQRMFWLHDLRRAKYPSRIEGYNLIKTRDTSSDEGKGDYGLVISRNDSIKFRTGNGAGDLNDVTYIPFPLLPNGRKQVMVEEWTGGMNCCGMYWILDLGDTVSVLYHSDGTETEFASILEIGDFDGDGSYEFVQTLGTFEAFGGLCEACSPHLLAVFKYSPAKRCFVVASRSYPSVVLGDVEETKAEVQQLLDTTKVFSYDASWELLSGTLDVLVRYIYAGQDSIGWDYFNKNYALSDSIEVRKKIRDTLEASTVYKQLYQR
ncbi:MAG: hypothetical protein WAO19_12340 [Candidatus Kryptoniota bacterium]